MQGAFFCPKCLRRRTILDTIIFNPSYNGKGYIYIYNIYNIIYAKLDTIIFYPFYNGKGCTYIHTLYVHIIYYIYIYSCRRIYTLDYGVCPVIT